MPAARSAGLLAAVALDAALGDPARLHPVAGFGQLAAALERAAYRPSRPAGAAYAAALVAGPALAAARGARGAGRRARGARRRRPARAGHGGLWLGRARRPLAAPDGAADGRPHRRRRPA